MKLGYNCAQSSRAPPWQEREKNHPDVVLFGFARENQPMRRVGRPNGPTQSWLTFSRQKIRATGHPGASRVVVHIPFWRKAQSLGGNMPAPPPLGERASAEDRSGQFASRRTAANPECLTRPSFSTACRERPLGLSHLRQTLNPGVPVLPCERASLDAIGQWPVSHAGASPTEDPSVKRGAACRIT